MGVPTERFASKYHVKPESVISRVCRTGSYFGIRPHRLPNGRLDWPDDASGHDADRSASLTAQPIAAPNIGVDGPNTASVDPLPSPRGSWRQRLKAKRNGTVGKEAK